MNPQLTGGATHYLLAHLSVKSTEWRLRREFPIAPTFRPSSVPLPYTELDTASRAAIHEHLKHINGGEDDMASVNWVLDSCWKLNDSDEWFSFAIVLLCCPVARAVRRGTVTIPDPKPRVIYHLTTTHALRAEYTLEYSMPVSTNFNPSMAPSASAGSMGPGLGIDYDTADPGARQAIQQIIERANDNVTDILRKPWGLCTISRVNRPTSRRNMTTAEKDYERKKVGFAVILEWQPGPVEVLTQDLLMPVPLHTMTNQNAGQQPIVAGNGLPPHPGYRSNMPGLPPSYTPEP